MSKSKHTPKIVASNIRGRIYLWLDDKILAEIYPSHGQQSMNDGKAEDWMNLLGSAPQLAEENEKLRELLARILEQVETDAIAQHSVRMDRERRKIEAEIREALKGSE